LYLAPPPPPPQNIVLQLSLPLSPQAEAIPARKKPRYEEKLPTITDDSARKSALPDLLLDLPTPDTPHCTDTVNSSTRRRNRH
jgi:hypothetical protein